MQKVKAKLSLMIITLGLIIGVNNYPGLPSTFIYSFDVLAWIYMILLLFGIKNDQQASSTPEIRRKIILMLAMLVSVSTLIINQYVVKPFIYPADLIAFIVLAFLFRAYKLETKTDTENMGDAVEG